jgi:threonine/homoserine/homoserine lactone efflux protein
MPSTNTLLAFTATAMALILLPGPGMLLLLARGISAGRRPALFSAFGLETGTAVYVAATAAGLSALLASSALAFSAVRYAGAVYLLVLGVRTLAGRTSAGASRVRAQLSATCAYRQALLIGLTNPKIAIFFLALFPQFVDPDNGPTVTQVLVLGAEFVVLALGVDLFVASAAGTVGGWLSQHPTLAHRQRYVTGSIYVALGASAAAGPTRG